MNSIQLSEFKTLFEKEKTNLVYSQKILNDDFLIHPSDLADEVDLTATEIESSMRMRLRNREALFLKKIDQALERIKSGTYGFCESCEEEIELKRLQARPTTTLCVSCKEDEEHRETAHADGRIPKSLGRNLRLA